MHANVLRFVAMWRIHNRRKDAITIPGDYSLKVAFHSLHGALNHLRVSRLVQHSNCNVKKFKRWEEQTNRAKRWANGKPSTAQVPLRYFVAVDCYSSAACFAADKRRAQRDKFIYEQAAKLETPLLKARHHERVLELIRLASLALDMLKL